MLPVVRLWLRASPMNGAPSHEAPAIGSGSLSEFWFRRVVLAWVEKSRPAPRVASFCGKMPPADPTGRLSSPVVYQAFHQVDSGPRGSRAVKVTPKPLSSTFRSSVAE